MGKNNNIDYSSLFKLRKSGATRPIFLTEKVPLASLEEAQQLLYGEKQPEKPVLLKIKTGAQAADILWSSITSVICISQRTLDLLRDNGFTGWSTYPVEIYNRKDELIPGYHGFAITSYAGKANISRSQVITLLPPGGGNPYKAYKGIYFDESKWDGSDIFRIYAENIIVTRRVRDAFKKEKISNIHLIPLPEVETNAAIFKVLPWAVEW